MTKSELVDAIAARAGIERTRAERVVDVMLEGIIAAVEQGEGIEIRGFGSMHTRQKDAHNARNPRTGKRVQVPEKTIPVFRVAKGMKQLLDYSSKLVPLNSR